MALSFYAKMSWAFMKLKHECYQGGLIMNHCKRYEMDELLSKYGMNMYKRGRMDGIIETIISLGVGYIIGRTIFIRKKEKTEDIDM